MNQLVYPMDGYWRELSAPHKVHQKYALMSGGPAPVILLVATYVYVVRLLGPKMMKSRQPYDLRWTIRLYNLAMASINGLVFVRGSLLTRFGLRYFQCHQTKLVGADSRELVYLTSLYFIIKIVQLLDTVFFVLRKKHNQASKMHVFHHSFMVLCVWFYIKLEPRGGLITIFPYLHVGVHTLVYSYYFVSSFKSMRPHLWWKRHLTSLEMLMLVVTMAHCTFLALFDCSNYSLALTSIGFAFSLVFLVLFWNFYCNSYMKTTNKVGHSSSQSSTRTELDKCQ